MIVVLTELEETCIIIQEYNAILGPELKQVTGRTDLINEKIEKVKQEVKKIEEFNRDIFNQKHEDAWKATLANFRQ